MWILGDSHVRRVAERILVTVGVQMDLEKFNYELTWKGRGGLLLRNTCSYLEELLLITSDRPQILLFHVGTNDLLNQSNQLIYQSIREVIQYCGRWLPHVTIIWSAIFPRPYYRGADNQRAIKKKRAQINRSARNLVWKAGGKYLDFPYLEGNVGSSFRRDDIHLSASGYDYFANVIRYALEFFYWFPLVIKYPPFNHGGVAMA